MVTGDPASRASAFLRSHTALKWATGSSCDLLSSSRLPSDSSVFERTLPSAPR